MRSIKLSSKTAPPLIALLCAAVAASASTQPSTGLTGRVMDAELPVEAAKVYAYEIGSYTMLKGLTDGQGRFAFADLPAGLYKIVAFKAGFVPAVEVLLRRAPDLLQSLEIQLVESRAEEAPEGESFWTVRSRIPADVLRDIAGPVTFERAAEASTLQLTTPADFQTKMGAGAGVENLGPGMGTARLTDIELGFRGEVGQVGLDLRGRLQQLNPMAAVGSGDASPGEVRSLALTVDNADDSTLRLATASSELTGDGSNDLATVGLDQYQLHWSGRTADGAESSLAASYTEELNYYQAGWLDPAQLPDASQTLRLEGSYSRDLEDGTSLQAGVHYRHRNGQSLTDEAGGDQLEDERLGLFGFADSQLAERVLVEYGLYSAVRDGSLSLMPHGGVVVDLGRRWHARTALSHRIEERSEQPLWGFSTALFGDDAACREAGAACYEVVFSHGSENGESVSVGAVHRRYAETLRMYFSRDFFDRLESLFVVRGDEVPEVQLSVVRRVTPQILARLESNYATGGGGIFYATDQLPYENQVRYLVTSLDTHFQQTSTGVFIAFHHLEQALEPIARRQAAAGNGPELEIDRLQLMLTQDLNVLLDASSRWAVNLNMELSRGSNPYTLTSGDGLYKKLTGGFSVSF